RLVVYNKRCCDHFLPNQNNHETIFYRCLALHQLKSIRAAKGETQSKQKKQRPLVFASVYLFICESAVQVQKSRVEQCRTCSNVCSSVPSR
ncbi:unnamed protein product, partial [Callosobruchus maculatus]